MDSRIIRDFAAILLCTLAGKAVASVLPFTFPGSIIGMLLLFALLATGVVKVEWVAKGSDLLLKYMALMFVPIGVGLVVYLDELASNAVAFLLSTVVSTFVTMAVVALAYRRLRS